MTRQSDPIRTVQHFIDHKMQMSGWCDVCGGREVKIDLHVLGRARGFDLDLYERPPPIKCSQCDTRVESFQVRPDPLLWMELRD